MRKIRVLDNVYDLITINMEDRFKDNVAFRFYDTANDAVTTILYKDYVQDIRKAVNYFQSTIPEIKGKKICLLTKNSYEYAVNTFGVVAAGAVLVLLNQRKSWGQLELRAGPCGAGCHPDRRRRLRLQRPAQGCLRRYPPPHGWLPKL